MTTSQIIVHLKMLGFKNRTHESTPYYYTKNVKQNQIDISISKSKISVHLISLVTKSHKKVQNTHEQGLRYLANLLFKLKQETK